MYRLVYTLLENSTGIFETMTNFFPQPCLTENNNPFFSLKFFLIHFSYLNIFQMTLIHSSYVLINYSQMISESYQLFKNISFSIQLYIQGCTYTYNAQQPQAVTSQQCIIQVKGTIYCISQFIISQ